MDLLLPLTIFAFTMGITPGPNNVMLTASGANFGFRRTMPHIAGIVLGFPLMVLAVGLGLGGLFVAYPQIHQVLRVVGIGYLLWLSWKIATAGREAYVGAKARPLNFLQAAGFQWVNPKAWILAVGAIATYSHVQGDVVQEVALITAVMFVVAFPCAATWTAFGTGIGRLLKSNRARTLFNWSMAALLVASVLPLALR
ncbi:MAG: LysE family translocator [Alphaproteobacteria bacterium]